MSGGCCCAADDGREAALQPLTLVAADHHHADRARAAARASSHELLLVFDETGLHAAVPVPEELELPQHFREFAQDQRQSTHRVRARRALSQNGKPDHLQGIDREQPQQPQIQAQGEDEYSKGNPQAPEPDPPGLLDPVLLGRGSVLPGALRDA